MGNLGDLFTSTQGRIGRQQWWIGTIILILINLAVTFLIFPLIGFGMPNIAALDPAGDPAAFAATISGALQKSYWASLILFIILAYPLYAIGIKRRHDKDNNGMDLIIYLALTVIFLLVNALGIGNTNVDIGGGVMMPTPGIITTVLTFAVGIYAIYMLVVLGFLKGTTGPNQYGPDPLGGA